jgi:DNA-binding Xre family transcriptional regulator
MDLREKTRKCLGDFLKSARGHTPLRIISVRLKSTDSPMSTSTLNRIENAQMGTHVDQFEALCEAYGVEFRDLINTLLNRIGMMP